MSSETKDMSPQEVALAKELEDTATRFAHTLACLFNNQRQIAGLDNTQLVWCHQHRQNHAGLIAANIEARIDHDSRDVQFFLIKGKDNEIFQCEANHLVQDYHMTMVRSAQFDLDTQEIIVAEQVIALVLVRHPAQKSQQEEPQDD